ncbi:MAG: spoIIIJ-associated protein [Frankiales bacterium]|nr:spoIIIJ-associated protein [Frankiales bacterium]
MTETSNITDHDASTSAEPRDGNADATADGTTDGTADGTAAETATEPAAETAGEGGSTPAPKEPVSRARQLEQEGEIAADYLEGLLDIADLDGDIDMDVEGDRAMVSIVGGGLAQLVGPGGKVLDALQDLTRLAVLRETGERSRLMLDIDGHRAKRREVLSEQGAEAARTVLESGQPVRMAPMSPFERKVVHDAVAAVEGVTSESEGEEPSRRVVVLPA